MTDYKPAKLNNCKGDVSKQWYVYYFTLVDGKFKMHIAKGGINRIKTKRERTAEGNAIVTALNQLLKEGWRPKGTDLVEKAVTLIARLDELLLLKKSLRRRTWQSYQYSIDVLKRWLIANRYDYFLPDDFTLPICHKFFDSLQSQKLAGKTLNGYKSQLSVFFNMMVGRELIQKNPFSKIRKFQENTGRNIAFNNEQKADLEEDMKTYNYRLYLFTQWIYYTCIRPIELLRLKVSNVDFEKGIIRIHSNQSKNKRDESVVIPDAFKPIVDKMCLDKKCQSDFIFGAGLKTCSTSLGRNSVSLAFKKVLVKLKFGKDYTLYSWKHTSVVNAFNAGINPYAIQRQLRHQSLDQTMVYLKSLGLLRNDEFGSKMR